MTLLMKKIVPAALALGLLAGCGAAPTQQTLNTADPAQASAQGLFSNYKLNNTYGSTFVTDEVVVWFSLKNWGKTVLDPKFDQQELFGVSLFINGKYGKLYPARDGKLYAGKFPSLGEPKEESGFYPVGTHDLRAVENAKAKTSLNIQFDPGVKVSYDCTFSGFGYGPKMILEMKTLPARLQDIPVFK